MNDDKRMTEISEIQAKYVDDLMGYAHVVGVGIGMRQHKDEYTDEMCIVVMVDEKVPVAQLDAESVLPTHLEGVGIDVQDTGEFSA